MLGRKCLHIGVARGKRLVVLVGRKKAVVAITVRDALGASATTAGTFSISPTGARYSSDGSG